MVTTLKNNAAAGYHGPLSENRAFERCMSTVLLQHN